MSNFLKGIVEYKATSDIDAYAKEVSKWLLEVKEGGFSEKLLDELIAFAEKAEKKQATEATQKSEEKKFGFSDGSRVATLK